MYNIRNDTNYNKCLPKQYKIIDNIQRELLSCGGKFFSREEVLSLSVEELMHMCICNNVEFKLTHKRRK